MTSKWLMGKRTTDSERFEFPKHQRCANVKAQGAALGKVTTGIKPRRGAIAPIRLITPPSGLGREKSTVSQGCALGFNIGAPSVLNNLHLQYADAYRKPIHGRDLRIVA